MKKLLALLLAAIMVLALAACGSSSSSSSSSTETSSDAEESTVKIGCILCGDENEGYTYAHISGIEAAIEATGISSDNVIMKYSVPENEECYDAAVDLAEQGCTLIISNSYSHQSYMQQAATEFPDVTFVSCTGDTALSSGLSNFKNAFTGVYQSRYVSGVVAGMKIAELVEAGALTDANYDADGKVKIGYVGAYPYAEVVSGYTAFFLGIQSVYENVSMEVTYTNSWFDITAEGTAAESLIADGCVIIGQHADSTGAPAAVQAAYEAGTTVFSVGYNIDMLSVAPDVALTSATNNWGVFYTYAFECILNGEEIATNWSEGYESGAVAITELGSACAEGTAEAVAEVEAALLSGELHVFDITTFTVNGETVTSTYATDTDGDYVYDADEAIIDGYYHESYYQSAPSFSLRIDGITELN